MAKWGMFGRFANTLVFLFSDSIASCLSVKINCLRGWMKVRVRNQGSETCRAGGVGETVQPRSASQLGTLTEPKVHICLKGFPSSTDRKSATVPQLTYTVCVGNTRLLIAELNSAPGSICSPDQKITDRPQYLLYGGYHNRRPSCTISTVLLRLRSGVGWFQGGWTLMLFF